MGEAVQVLKSGVYHSD